MRAGGARRDVRSLRAHRSRCVVGQRAKTHSIAHHYPQADRPSPSIAAASSSSVGMVLMKPVRTKIGRATRLHQRRMWPSWVVYSPSCCKMKNCGPTARAPRPTPATTPNRTLADPGDRLLVRGKSCSVCESCPPVPRAASLERRDRVWAFWWRRVRPRFPVQPHRRLTWHLVARTSGG